jgi:Flp pilus assembly protein TadB
MSPSRRTAGPSPEPFSEAELDWHASGYRRLLLRGLGSLWAATAAVAVVAMLITRDGIWIVWCVACGAMLGTAASWLLRDNRRKTERRRAEIHRFVEGHGPDGGEAPQPFTEAEVVEAHARARRALVISTVGMWVCVATLVALAIWGLSTVVVPLAAGVAFCALGTFLARGALRNLDRTLDARRAELRSFLAQRQHGRTVSN